VKLIIPMAGRGSRLRPHTLTVPKPLIPIAGKPIVQRLVEDIAKVCHEKIDEVVFVIGDFGTEVEQNLLNIAASIGAKGTICYQDKPLGTAHAVLCAGNALVGNTIVAFADTLFKADFQLDASKDGAIWVKKVEDPSSFGVVKLDNDGVITDFIEKPKTAVSDLAIIGIYYFKSGERLREALQHLADHQIMVNGEYQLTDALENLKNDGNKFVSAKVNDWLDCGNKNATVDTNTRYLDYLDPTQIVDKSLKAVNSVVIPPVYIGRNVTLENTVIGPYVSVGDDCTIQNSLLSKSIIQENTKISNVNLTNSMLGSHVSLEGTPKDVSLGDYNTIKY